ncbi:class C sortase [Corynebacterium propinquum]|uniref:class C sortase n=1 Tax=Corynebacterium propinquum TaxID=43769 RepID=UPI0020BD738E|nr:class C sortase [Corynebacterium propinquum]UQV59701.1 class C sortase [Corynebacterium propinquum]
MRTNHTTRQKPRRRYRSVVYFLLALAVFLSPVVLTHYKNVEQHNLAAEYSENIVLMPAEHVDPVLEAAHAYNQGLVDFPVSDPWKYGVDTASHAYQEYEAHLDVEGLMARIEIPSVGVDLPVYHGTSTDVLAAGVGHLFGTDLPVGGQGTHSVLTGHTGMATLTMFDNLTSVEPGEIFTVESMGQKIAYQVDQIQTVLPDEVEHLRAEEGKDQMTLVTCTPYGLNTHRLLVRGQRVEIPEQPLTQTYYSPWQPWMVASVVISLLTLIYLAWWLAGRGRKARRAAV